MLVFGAVFADLVFVEHVIGLVDDLLHVNDGTDAGDVHISQHGEDQDGLHQQLSVLRLRDSVQNCLHMDRELYLPGGHLTMNGKNRLRASDQKKSSFFQLRMHICV